MIVAKLKIKQTLTLRGKRSRNKVSVGEPAEGSFIIHKCFSRIKVQKEGNFFFVYLFIGL